MTLPLSEGSLSCIKCSSVLNKLPSSSLMESGVERQTPAHQCWIHCINADLSLFSLAQCPANEVRTESSGVILSPGYPGNYFNSQTCAWSIKVEPDFNITLFVDTFQSEKQFDALEVFDGKPLSICLSQCPEHR